MARRKTTRRKTRRTKSFYVPKRGGRRKTARRAFMPVARRRRRSNPKGITQQPAFRFGAWAVGGAAAYSVVSQFDWLKQTVKNDLARATIFAAATIAIGSMLKGKAKQNAIALGVGMVTVPVVKEVAKLDLGGKFKGLTNGESSRQEEVRRIQRRMQSQGNAYAEALSHSRQVAAGGLRTF